MLLLDRVGWGTLSPWTPWPPTKLPAPWDQPGLADGAWRALGEEQRTWGEETFPHHSRLCSKPPCRDLAFCRGPATVDLERDLCQIFCQIRIIECFGLEGTFRGHLAQPPCSEQGHLQLDQSAQSSIQPGLECSQGWGISHLSG